MKLLEFHLVKEGPREWFKILDGWSVWTASSIYRSVKCCS